MKWIYRLERRLGRGFGIPNMMAYITATALAAYLLNIIIMPQLFAWMILIRNLVFQGQVWRLVTFLFVVPPGYNILVTIMVLYAAYIFGVSLENAWGPTLFTLYYIFGAAGAIIAGFISGLGDNSYLYLSFFLAYAYLYPENSIMLFYVLPIKAKYIAYLNWALYLYAFVTGDFSSRLALVFSLINFFLFFGPEIWSTAQQNYKQSKRRRSYRKNWKDGWR